MIFYLRGDNMLLQFRVKNAKSFHDEAILDFTASGITEHENHVRKKNGNECLPLIAIYGANAAGKTNILSAFTDMCYFIKSSIQPLDKEKGVRLLTSAFLFSNKPAEYEATISLEIDYRYGFSITSNGDICSEYLEYRKTIGGSFFRIFEREKDHSLKISEADVLSKEERKAIKSISSMVSEEELLLTMLGSRRGTPYARNLTRFTKLYDWFYSAAECPECSNRKLDSLEVFDDTQLSNMFSEDHAIDEYLEFVQKADPTIKGIKLHEMNEQDPGSKHGQDVVINRNWAEYAGDQVDCPTVLESSGTMYIMRAYPMIKQVLDNGGLLVADEIDRSLHPVLLLDIINLFTNPDTNPNNAQLLCTMHNVVIMDRRFLRRDEIWFVERNDKGESSLYSLADFAVEDKAVRKDADFCKNYILGRYGAVPERQ